jgi:PKD domain
VSITDSAGGVAAAGEMVTFIATPVDPDAVVNGYEWDLDGDGFDDGEQFSAHAIYTVPGPVTARVRATDHRGARAVASRSITVR